MSKIKSFSFAFVRVLSFVVLVLLLPLNSVAQTFQWKTQEISKDNNLQGMSVTSEGTAVIAGFGETFKITTDNGRSWSDVGLLNPKYNFNDISIQGQVGYMVGRKTLLVANPTGGEDDVYVNGVLLKTTDGGNSWALVDLSKIGTGTNPALNPSLTGNVYLNPYTVLCVNESVALMYLQWYELVAGTKKTHSAVFKTVNGGDQWTALTSDFGVAYVTSMRLIDTDIYIGGSKILMKASTTTDTTTDLFPAFSAVAGSSAFINDIHSFKTGDVSVITSASGFFNSNDGGKTFTKQSGISGGFDFFKTDNNVIIVVGTAANTKATVNGGTSWVSCSPGKTCVEVPGVFNDSLYVLSSGSAIYKMAIGDLKSGNYKWAGKTIAPGTASLQKMYMFDANSALILGDVQIAKKTTDKGLTWTDAAFPQLYKDKKYDFRSLSSSGNAGFASTRVNKLVDYPSGGDYYLSGLVYKTDDAWKTWKVLNNKNVGKAALADPSAYPFATGCYGMDNYTVECIDAQTAYLNVNWFDTISVPKTITKHSRVFKTTDGGDLWSAVTKDFGSTVIASIKFSGTTGYIAGNKILLKTNDGGTTFTDLYPKITVGTDSSLVINSIVMRTVNELYFQTSNNKGVFLTRDGGSTFSKLGGVTGGLDFVVINPNSFLALGSSTSNKFTSDGGLTWKNCNLGAAIYAAGKVFNDSLYVLGKSNVYKIAMADLDLETGIADLKAPEPFKVLYGPATLEIISAEGEIDRCFVYNMAGQLLAIANPKSSTYSITQNSFSPGVYIISVQIGGKKFAQKVIFK